MSKGASQLAARPLRRICRKGRAPSLHLPITALIDVVFLLLMYFALAGRFHTPERAIFAATAPAAGEAAALTLPALPALVRVERSDVVRAGSYARINALAPLQLQDADVVELEARARELAAKGALGASQRIIVRAAAEARWQDAIDVVAALARAGVRSVRIESEASL